MHEEHGPSPLGLPPRLDRPFFAYGVFKPTELAYSQLSDLVADVRADSLRGALLVRDGFTVYRPGDGGIVEGFRLSFEGEGAEEAYRRIGDFEPKRLYKWVEATTFEGVHVNVVAGRGQIPGAVPHEHEDWSLWRDDAMFRDGLNLILEAGACFSDFAFPSTPPDDFPWARFFELQMLHMFAWTLLERYVAMRVGPRMSPSQAASMLGRDELFALALSESDVRIDRALYDTRGGSPYHFSREDPGGAAKYLYQLRSNVVHRGKGAHQDAELLRLGLLVIADVLQKLRERAQGPRVVDGFDRRDT